MKPYYQDNLATIYHGNCLDILPNFHDAVVITDPPFNVNYHYGSYKDNLKAKDYQDLLRITCRQPSAVIHYPEQICAVSAILGVIPTRMVAWVYPSNTGRQWRAIGWFGCKPDFRRDGQDFKNPLDKRIAERIKNGKRARLYDWWEINQVKNVSKEKTAHPCQMPLQVMEHIVRITPAKLVVDPFLGSGTTIVAAKKNGVKSAGIELDEKYCEIAAKRLREVFK